MEHRLNTWVRLVNEEVDEQLVDWVQNLEIGHFSDVSLSRPDRAILLYSILLLYDLYW